MNSRIRDLEAALSSTQAQLTPHPHPLLTEGARFNDAETLALLTSEEPEPISDDIDEATEAMGTMSVGENGQTRFHGQSTASEASKLQHLMDFTAHMGPISSSKHYFRFVICLY